MKKLTLVCAAVAGTFAMTASAADITLYGILDTGFGYVHDGSKLGDAQTRFTMDSSSNLGSRFGIKGEEKLTDTLSAGFVLENGFSSDTGALSDNGRLFGRESVVYLTGNFGKLRFGRMTQLSGSTGTTSIMAGKFSAMSTGWGNVYGHNAVFSGMFSRMDNMIMYSTPKWAGLQLHVQYSSGIDSNEKDRTGKVAAQENTGETTRYIAVGAECFNGPFSMIGEVEQTRYANTDADEGYSAALSVGYDFEVAKLLVAAQYTKDVRHLGKQAVDSRASATTDANKNAVYEFGNNVAKDGYAFNVGFSAPIAGGKLYADVGYGSYEASDDSSKELTRWMASTGYEYYISKRTTVYGGVGYYVDDYESKTINRDNAEMFGMSCGLIHKF